MARRDKSRFALLGILTLGPHSGYDIKRFVDEVLSHFWRESYGQIYPRLAQLEEEGLVQKEAHPGQGHAERNVYSLTPQGKQAFVDWLDDPPELPPVRNELLLKIFFGRARGPDAMIAQVRQFLESCTQMQRTFDEIAAEMREEMGDEPDYPYWQLTLDMGQRIAQAREDWCRAALKTLRRLAREETSP